MKKVLTSVVLVLVMAGMNSFASAPDSYDLKLRPCDTPYEYMIGPGDADSAKLLVFDYWYEPDLVPDAPESFLRYIESEGIPQDLRMSRGGSTHSMGTIMSYFPSTTWETNTADLPSGSDILFNMPVRRGYGYVSTEWTNRIIDNTYYIRNIRFYCDYEEYCHNELNNGNNNTNGQPVPEPGTFIMLGTGILGLLGFEIKRRA